jgi:hypothetical protein
MAVEQQHSASHRPTSWVMSGLVLSDGAIGRPSPDSCFRLARCGLATRKNAWRLRQSVTPPARTRICATGSGGRHSSSRRSFPSIPLLSNRPYRSGSTRLLGGVHLIADLELLCSSSRGSQTNRPSLLCTGWPTRRWPRPRRNRLTVRVGRAGNRGVHSDRIGRGDRASGTGGRRRRGPRNPIRAARSDR